MFAEDVGLELEAAVEAEGVEPEPDASDSGSGSEAVTQVTAGREAVIEADAAEVAEGETVAEAEEATVEAEPSEESEASSGAEGARELAEAEIEATEGEAAAEEGEEDELVEPEDDRAWYVIHCYSGYESKVKHNLEQRIETMQMQDQIFQVVVPTEDEIEVRDGRRRTVERRVFPGYILVQMLLSDDSWYVVRNTPGVTGFVGMGNEPTPLRPEEVQTIMRRMEAEAPKIKVTFKPGQKVRIIDGPFNEFIGVVDEIDMERAKVRVLVSFFGRETPVELDFLQVEKT